jgi:DNA-binding MarR family transcriptional regulator
MESERPAFIERILHTIACMYDRPHATPWDHWSRIDLTVQQLKTLAALWGQPAARMRDLSAMLGVNLSTATGIVDRLVERGYLERRSHPEDRRSVLVQLSDEGREEIGRIMRLGQAQFADLLDFVSTEDLPIVAQCMDIMVRASNDYHAAMGTRTFHEDAEADDEETPHHPTSSARGASSVQST